MCTARIRPFRPINETEIACQHDIAGHPLQSSGGLRHSGVLTDYAHPGSETLISWSESDRRNFHGRWPGACSDVCILPDDHDGDHAR